MITFKAWCLVLDMISTLLFRSSLHEKPSEISLGMSCQQTRVQSRIEQKDGNERLVCRTVELKAHSHSARGEYTEIRKSGDPEYWPWSPKYVDPSLCHWKRPHRDHQRPWHKRDISFCVSNWTCISAPKLSRRWDTCVPRGRFFF